jgi:hypothetical protein
VHSCSEFRAGHCSKKTRQPESEGPTARGTFYACSIAPNSRSISAWWRASSASTSMSRRCRTARAARSALPGAIQRAATTTGRGRGTGAAGCARQAVLSRRRQHPRRRVRLACDLICGDAVSLGFARPPRVHHASGYWLDHRLCHQTRTMFAFRVYSLNQPHFAERPRGARSDG